jgi:hypothetical protein
LIEDVSDAAAEDSKKRLEAGDIVFRNNIWYGFTSGNGADEIWNDAVQDYCYDYMTQAANHNSVADPQINAISHTNNGGLDPRPSLSGPAAGGAIMPSGSFFNTVSYKGAFNPSGESWLKGWTALDDYGFLQ